MTFIDDYLAWQQEQRRRTPNTIRMYTCVLGAFERDVVRGRDLGDVELHEMEAWVQRERVGGQAGKDGRAPADATIARDTTIVRGLFKWAHARGVIERDPSVLFVAPTPKNEQPKPIPDETWIEWWEARLPLELRLALALGFYGGLRRAEITSLRVEQIDLAGIRLVGFTRKGGGDDVLPLGTGLRIYATKLPHLLASVEEVVDLFRPSVNAGVGPAVGWLEQYPPERRGEELARWIDRTGRRLRLPRFTCHQLRHATATNLLRAGVPIALVSRYLNHRSITTTMRYAKQGGDELGEWFRST